MSLLRIATLSSLLVFCSVQARADSIPSGDPVVKTGGSGGTGTPILLGAAPAPASIITPDFSIFTASGASPATSPCVLIQGTIMTSSPQCFFENDITQNGSSVSITQLVFDFGIGGVTCGILAGSPFDMCKVGPFGDGGTQVTFFDGSIPFHSDFTLVLGTPSDPFPEHTTTAGTASLSPEPTTLGLFLVNIAALLAGRRLRPRRSHS